MQGPSGRRKIIAGNREHDSRGQRLTGGSIVWTMLFSRIVEPPSFFSTEMASTAIGIDALTVRPARSPR